MGFPCSHRKHIFNETTTAISAAMLSEPDPTPQLGGAAKQPVMEVQMRPSGDGGLPKALVMHREFGAVSSEQTGNA